MSRHFRVGLAVALVSAGWPAVAGAQPTSGGAPEAWAEFAPPDDDLRAQSLFTNCRRVAARAHLLGDGDPQTLLPDLARKLDVMLRSRLTAARIYAEAPDLPHGLVLYLYVTVGDADDSSPRRLYRTTLEASRFLIVPLTGREWPFTAWSARHGSHGYATRLADIESAIERAVSVAIDEFILEYLHANEAACETQGGGPPA